MWFLCTTAEIVITLNEVLGQVWPCPPLLNPIIIFFFFYIFDFLFLLEATLIK